MKPLPSQLQCKVVGVTFCAGYPENVYALEETFARRVIHGEESEIRATLVREPANEHDPNAILVHVAGAGMVGHIPAAVAVRLAESLDRHESWSAAVERIAIVEGAPEHPGIQLRLNRKEAA